MDQMAFSKRPLSVCTWMTGKEEGTDPFSPSVLLRRLLLIGLTGRGDQGPEVRAPRPVRSDWDAEREGAESEARAERAVWVVRAHVYKRVCACAGMLGAVTSKLGIPWGAPTLWMKDAQCQEQETPPYSRRAGHSGSQSSEPAQTCPGCHFQAR